MTVNKQLLNAALEYAEQGWHVFPCGVKSKKPITKHGLLDASTDPAQIRAWWEATPQANIGIACGPSNLVVVDLDGEQGKTSWATSRKNHGFDDNTLTSLTGGGGVHLVFQASETLIPNSTTGMGPGVHIRGAGGYIIAPPSIHPSDKAYAWDNVCLQEPQPLPAPVLDALLRQKRSPAPSVEGKAITEGKRNSTLVSLAGSMRRRGMSEASILAALLAENEEKCQPPLKEKEIETIARSVAKYPPATETPPEEYYGAPPEEYEQDDYAAEVEPPVSAAEEREGILGWEVWTAEKAFEPRPPLQYVVEGLFTLPSLNIVYGQPGGKKSMAMVDMAVCVAAGIPWLDPLPGHSGRGLSTIQVPVMLLDFDNGSRRMHERVEACVRGHGLDPAHLPLHYVSMPSPWLDASSDRAMDDLISLAREKGVKFIVIDNLGTVSGGKDENTGEMIAVLTNFRRLAERAGAATNVIHHERKQSKNTAGARRGESLRGFSGIEAALDAAVQVNLGENKDEITFFLTKTRDYVRPVIGALFSFDHKEGSTELEWAKLWGREIDYDTREDKARKAMFKVLYGRTLNTKDLTAATKGIVPDIGVNQIGNVIREEATKGTLTVRPGERNNEKLYTIAE